MNAILTIHGAREPNRRRHAAINALARFDPVRAGANGDDLVLVVHTAGERPIPVGAVWYDDYVGSAVRLTLEEAEGLVEERTMPGPHQEQLWANVVLVVDEPSAPPAQQQGDQEERVRWIGRMQDVDR